MFFFFIHYSKVNPHCYIFSSPELKAQWWAYRIGRPLLSVCVCAVGMSTCRTSSPLKPLGWLKPNFIWSLLGTGERKSVQTVQVTWPRWPPCPYILKTVKKIFFSGIKRPMTLKLSMQHWVLKFYQICSNNDPGLSLTYFMARSDLFPCAFVLEKGKTIDISEIIVVYDVKNDRW